jgi:hypothetical protein
MLTRATWWPLVASEWVLRPIAVEIVHLDKVAGWVSRDKIIEKTKNIVGV